jgi:hypothetical protein
MKKLPPGKCRCGAILPGVYPDETPFEFCTAQCRVEAAAPELLDAAISALNCLRNMTTEQFANGEDRPFRLKLQGAIAKAEGRTT